MRKIWVKIDPWNKKLVTTALEGGADGLRLPKGVSEKVKELGKIQTISEAAPKDVTDDSVDT